MPAGTSTDRNRDASEIPRGNRASSPDYPLRNCQSVKSRAPCRERADVVEHFLHEAVPMRIQCRFAQLIAFQTSAFGWRGMIFHADWGVAQAEDNPITGRGVPTQPPARRELRR